MAALFLEKRAVISIYRASYRDHPRCVVSPSRAYFSTAFQRAQGTSVAAETRRETSSPDKKTPGISFSATNDPARQGLHEAKQQALDPENIQGQTAKEGVRKANQVADTIGDATKETMDGAREAANEANDCNNSHDHNSHDNSSNKVEDPEVVDVRE